MSKHISNAQITEVLGDLQTKADGRFSKGGGISFSVDGNNNLTASRNGTPINIGSGGGGGSGFDPLFKDGFENSDIEFNQDGSITTTYDDRVKTTEFNQDGSITETLEDLSGNVYATKTIEFNQDGSITETVTKAGGS